MTKCVAEQLMVERRGEVPMTIVRPSIISVSLSYPFLGWVDSHAAFAGLVAALGMGILRVIDGNSEARVDIVPVDKVAQTLLDGAFLTGKTVEDSRIVYAVATLKNSLDINTMSLNAAKYFRRKRSGPRPQLYDLGPRNWKFYFHDVLYHRLLIFMAWMYYGIRGDVKMRKRAETMASVIKGINRVFPYFMHHTFDFQPRMKLLKDMDMVDYLLLVCRGVEEHLLNKK